MKHLIAALLLITSSQLYSAADIDPRNLFELENFSVVAIHNAAKTNNVVRLTTLLDPMPHLINRRNNDVPKLTPLHTAVRYLQPEAVKYLLGRGANAQDTTHDFHRLNALHILAKEKPICSDLCTLEDQQARERAIAAIGQLLITAGTPIHRMDTLLRTPTQIAAQVGNYALIPLLVTAGAPLNAPGKDNLLYNTVGQTRNVHLDAQPNQSKTVETLLSLGATTNEPVEQDHRSMYVLDAAIMKSHINPAKRLLVANAPLSSSIPLLVFTPGNLFAFALACQELYNETSIKTYVTPETVQRLQPDIDRQKAEILANSDYAWLLHYGFNKQNPLAVVNNIKRGFTGYRLRRKLAHHTAEPVCQMADLDTDHASKRKKIEGNT